MQKKLEMRGVWVVQVHNLREQHQNLDFFVRFHTCISYSQDVSYEPSYLPFLFPSLPEHDPSAVSGTVAKLKGRRTFNKKGEDVSVEVSLSSSFMTQIFILTSRQQEIGARSFDSRIVKRCW